MKKNTAWTTPKVAEMLYIGREIPKELLKKGWKEVSAQHFGHGLWAFSLEADPKDLKL